MNLVFVTEARYVMLPDGSVYSLESSFSYPLYQRYLQSFDKVTIVARVKKGTKADVIESNLVTKDKVTVVPLPYYVGFNGFVKQYNKLKAAIMDAVYGNASKDTVFICRIPGRIGAIAISYLEKKRIPYGIEVVGDPYDVLSKGATRHPLRPIIRQFSYRSLKRLAAGAPAALYVTRYKLQERYPCPNFSIGASDVVMPPEAYRNTSKELFKSPTAKIICVGTLEQMYKAPDVIVKAMGILHNKGVNFEMKWVGDGIFRKEMEDLAKSLGLGDKVKFIGKVSGGQAVRDALDEADIYVMASRMEGLPRAMVEAMARGLPSIGTDICGIPELLDEQALIPTNDPQALADKIQYFIEHPSFAAEQGKRNLEEARTFAEELLKNERELFYDHLKGLVKQAN